MDIATVIPAKGTSQRVESKNTRSFFGTSLLEIKIKQLLEAKRVGPVYVSSENSSILKMAETLGAIPLYREPEYSTDHIPMSEVYAYMAGQINAKYILLAHVTNPLATANTYDRCADKFMKNLNKTSSLTTVNYVKEFLYLNGKPINFNPQKKPRSQDLPDIYKLNHVVSISKRSHIISNKEWFDSNVLFYPLSALESFDIDTLLDFEIAEFLYEKYVRNG